jgi:hypothetical protein
VDPDGTGFILISDLGNLIRKLITENCELFQPKHNILLYDSRMLTDLVQKLNLKVYKGFKYHHYYDVLIRLAQIQLQYLISRDKGPGSE